MEVEYLKNAAENVDFSNDASDADLKQECLEGGKCELANCLNCLN
jgi:hypothetical protein